MSKLEEIRDRANRPFATALAGVSQLDEDRDFLLAEVDRLQARIVSENRHWEAWEIYQGSGNFDNTHNKVFHRYVDAYVSYDYMAYVLSDSRKAPCGHDYEYGTTDTRPACEHCNREGLVGNE